MEMLVFNLVVKARRVTGTDGRAYLVAPVILLVPGVLNGSEGPLYYPPEECAKHPERWNGLPLTLDHPLVNGKPVSALETDVYDRVGLGFINNVLFHNRLKGEAWFDEEHTSSRSPTLHGALVRGEKVEVSTGLYTSFDPVAEKDQTTAVHNGRSYKGVVKDIFPDHLAILVDKIGACSIKDGCGVLVSHEGNYSGGEALLEEMICGPLLNADAIGHVLTLNPYPNEHAARVKDPGSFKKDSFRRKEIAPGVSAIFAKTSDDGPMVIQAYRFSASKFTAEEARAWLKKHHIDAKLEPATSTQNTDTPRTPQNTQGDAMTRQENIAWLTTNCECWKDPTSKTDLEKLTDPQIQKLRTNAEKTLRALEVEEAARKGFTDPGGSSHVYNTEKKTWETKAPPPVANATPAVSTSQGNPPVTPTPAPVQNTQAQQAQLTAEQEEDLAFARAEKHRRKSEIVNRLTANVTDASQKAAKVTFLMNKSLGELQTISELIPAPPQQAQNGYPGGPVLDLPSWVGASVPTGQQTQNTGEEEFLPLPTLNCGDDAITRRLSGIQ